MWASSWSSLSCNSVGCNILRLYCWNLLDDDRSYWTKCELRFMTVIPLLINPIAAQAGVMYVSSLPHLRHVRDWTLTIFSGRHARLSRILRWGRMLSWWVQSTFAVCHPLNSCKKTTAIQGAAAAISDIIISVTFIYLFRSQRSGTARWAAYLAFIFQLG